LLSDLTFGTESEKFEHAFNALGKALGFASERPDREWGEGPDNLWVLSDDMYLCIECKNEVKLERRDINEDETQQMNRSIGWFQKKYPGVSKRYLMIHPARKIAKDAAFIADEQVLVMTKNSLRLLCNSVRKFFAEFKDKDFQNLSSKEIQSYIDSHRLSVDTLLGADYMEPIRQRPGE
jgi:hypothetical protein